MTDTNLNGFFASELDFYTDRQNICKDSPQILYKQLFSIIKKKDTNLALNEIETSFKIWRKFHLPFLS